MRYLLKYLGVECHNVHNYLSNGSAKKVCVHALSIYASIYTYTHSFMFGKTGSKCGRILIELVNLGKRHLNVHCTTLPTFL